MLTYVVQRVAYTWDRGACLGSGCILDVTWPAKRRIEVLDKISEALLQNTGRDMLSSLQLSDSFCVDCAKQLKVINRECREEVVWAELPSLLGWESWEGV